MSEIRKIKLRLGGIKGAEVTKIVPDEKENRMKFREVTEKSQHPIHLGLEKLFKSLRVHMMKIYELDESGSLEEIYVDGVRKEVEWFTLFGRKEVLLEGKEYPLNNIKVREDDEYEGYGEVIEIIGQIEEEVVKYLEGKVKVSDAEIMAKWVAAGKMKGFDINAWEALPADERVRLSSNTIEKEFGGTVLLPEDVTVSYEDMKEAPQGFEASAIKEESDDVISTVDEFIVSKKETTIIPISGKKKTA